MTRQYILIERQDEEVKLFRGAFEAVQERMVFRMQEAAKALYYEGEGEEIAEEIGSAALSPCDTNCDYRPFEITATTGYVCDGSHYWEILPEEKAIEQL